LVITGAATAHALTTWRAQIWRRPQACLEAGATPLATAFGTVGGGTLTIGFTAAQMDIVLTADAGGYDDVWIVIAGTAADSQPHVVRAGWLRVQEGGFNPEEFPASIVAFTILDDVATLTFDGAQYSIPVSETETPPGAGQGTIIVIDEVLYFTPVGSNVSYAAPVTQQT